RGFVNWRDTPPDFTEEKGVRHATREGSCDSLWCLAVRTHGLCPGHVDSPVPRQDFGRAAGRPSPTGRAETLARSRAGEGRIARRAARDGSATGALLGGRLRLAQVRGETERPASIHDRDRWSGHSFHSRPLERESGVADHHYAWMAWFGHRAAEDH